MCNFIDVCGKILQLLTKHCIFFSTYRLIVIENLFYWPLSTIGMFFHSLRHELQCIVLGEMGKEINLFTHFFINSKTMFEKLQARVAFCCKKSVFCLRNHDESLCIFLHPWTWRCSTIHTNHLAMVIFCFVLLPLALLTLKNKPNYLLRKIRGILHPNIVRVWVNSLSCTLKRTSHEKTFQ